MNYQEALKIAIEKHKGQYRKVSAEPYVSHPIAVADKFVNENYKIVAVLHDTIEDTDLTIDELEKMGLEENLIHFVDILTRKPDQSYLDYILLCKRYRITKAVKIEDLKHNLSDNPSKCSRDKYLMALYILEFD